MSPSRNNVVKRDTARNAIKRCLIASKKADTYDDAELQSFLTLLNDQWSKFSSAQEAVDISCGETALPEQEPERVQGEEWYREALANFTRAANALRAPQEGERSGIPASQATRADIKLPRMDLPRFTGDPKEWRSFRDAFTSLIHNESLVSGAQKLHYLRCSLQGEALQVIKAFPITDDNYSEAWKLLKKRYDVERVIVDSHFRALFSIPRVTSESSTAIKALLDTTQEHFQSLKALGRPVTNWDDWLVHLTVGKLDAGTHRQWELTQTNDKVATFDTLVTFLETRCRSLDAVEAHKQSASANPKTQIISQNKVKSKLVSGSLHTATPANRPDHRDKNGLRRESYPQYKNSDSLNDVCVYCTAKHKIYKCDKFRALAASGRATFVHEKGLCTNCLGTGHDQEKCRSANTCRVCQVRHHTLLHQDTSSSTTAVSSSRLSPSYSTNLGHHVLLGTAIVKVADKEGRHQTARLLFDNASHLTFIKESCVQRLKLRKSPASTSIEGIGATAAGRSKGEVQVSLSSLDGSFSTTINAQVLPKITNSLPPIQIRKINWSHIDKLKLADPYYHVPADVDILLGSDELGQFLLDGLVKGPPGTPVAQQSTLGWVLFGKVIIPDKTCTHFTTISLHSDAALTKAVAKFWQIEELPETKHLTDEEQICESLFAETHYRLDDGRYVVKLPFKPHSPFGNSRDAAVRALLRMEGRFAKDEKLLTQYKDFMQEFLDLDHMEEVNDVPAPGKHYYMPHRAVIKDSSSTTKLRVVFNASCRTSSGFSLNDVQMIGPQLQPDLFSTLLRFRTHRFAMSADVAKMYRQIRVHKEHVDYQRIVWRNSTAEPIKDFRLLTVTYGVASASHLAVKALQQTAIDEGFDCPTAARVALRDFYMDDLLTGSFLEGDLHSLQLQLSALLSRGGFHLRKWSSNSTIVLDAIPAEHLEYKRSLDLSERDSVKTLGLHWHPSSDGLIFSVQVDEIDITNLTKRLLLSDAAKLFDPLGLLSPSTIIPKMLFQSLWRPKLDWDEAVPPPIKQQWLHYRENLPSLAAIKVPRWLGTGHPNAITDLHGFADASQSAYAAAVYARTEMPDGHITVRLITAKTRVAPLKTMTLPRLELCAAALLARLVTHVKASLEPLTRSIFGWTDSSVTLAWIRQHPSKWCTFVANRVSLIQKIIPPENWLHIKSAENPADCASRGVSPQYLSDHPLWWSGPSWLTQQEQSWPPQQHFVTILDQRPDPVNLVSNANSPQAWKLIERYSSLRKLKYVTAYVLRFLHNTRLAVASHNIGPQVARRTGKRLLLHELNEALNFWIKLTQKQFFPDDIHRLQSNKFLSPHSKLTRLHPFLDERGLLRVGGRLSNASLLPDKKYPLLLPASAKLTLLICDDIHKMTLHAGPQIMQSVLQSRFWVINARKILRKISRSCVKCRRHNHIIQQQLMGDLPKPRVHACRPFLRSGVDFAGPVQLRYSKGRGSKAVKGYISIFICMATGAMHLELASDLSSSTFISVFRRFVSRRGHCKELYSDNGTNFVGAEKELKTLLSHAVEDEQLHKYLVNDGTAWNFNPPSSPHMGGFWEAAVKRVKFHLRRTLGDNLLTFEEFTTLLTEIEACVNSRPLCPLSTDVNDFQALTPGHFLIGEPLKTIPVPDVAEAKVTLLNRWQLLSQLRQHFWRRWSTEYLVQLQQRAKWTRSTSSFNVGDLVVIRDERLPPTKWKMGRITAVHPGADGRVRVVTLKTMDGTLTRPIVKISPLLSFAEDSASDLDRS